MKYILTLSFLLFISSSFAQKLNFPTINPENIEIVRDEWGVPHIYGKTDAEAAYGLAWANAEDAFEVMQELLILGKGKMGIYQGESGAKADFFRHVIQAEQLVYDNLYTLPTEFLQYLDGYAQGINSYASQNEDRIKIKGLTPVTVEDILISYVVAMSAMTDASGAMERIYNGSLDKEEPVGLGSNAFAVSSSKSVDGDTYLCINPHLQMEGAFSFYEAHLNSEEGLNIHGALFPGGSSVFMGCNESLGWGMTWNHFTRGDTYQLEMHPKKKNTYKYDGEWKKLKKKKIWLKVKVGGITVPVPKTSYMSELGPVLKSTKSDEYYAFRYPAFMDLKAPYQWYRMDKAQNFEEYKEVLDIMGIGLFNIVYADKDDNIYYVTYGQVPLRSEEIASAKVVDGSKSENVWQRIRTLEELPQVENPKSGYVYNTNNTPFQSSAPADNPIEANFPSHLNNRPGQNNRALQLSEFLSSKEKVSYEEFQAIKFNNDYNPNAYLIQEMYPYSSVDPSDYPDISDILTLFQNWDFKPDTNDIESTIVMITLDKLFKKKGYGDTQFIKGFDINEEDFLTAIREAKTWLIKHYGTIHVRLGDVFIAKKGELSVPSPGFPDALAANYGKAKDDKYVLQYGDTYTQFVKFNENGVVDLRTQVPFGNSFYPESPYYFNQAPLFRDQQTKQMSLDKSYIYENAVQIYHPQ